MIKIAFVITGLSVGGAEMMLLKLLERLDRGRFSAHVFSLTDFGEIGRRIQALGISVEAVGMRGGVADIAAFLRLTGRLRVLQPDLVHTWMYHADLLGGVAARCAGVASVAWTLRHSDLSRDRNKPRTLLIAKICALLSRWVPDRILSCSRSAVENHSAIGYAKDRMVVIPNGFDLSRFKPDADARASVRAELGLPATTLLVGVVGRFDPQKNNLGFMQAAGLLHRRRPGVRFVLVGRGMARDNLSLMRAIEDAQVRGAVHLLGPRDDVPRLMGSFDVLANPSHGEGFPNVVGEAMACGVPCVVTRAGDSADVVGECGRVVAPGDMAAMATAIEELLAAPAAERARLGQCSRDRVMELFEIGAVVRQYEKQYQELA